MSVNVIQPALQQLRCLADLPPEVAIREARPLLESLLRSTNLLDRVPSIEGRAPTHIQLNANADADADANADSDSDSDSDSDADSNADSNADADADADADRTTLQLFLWPAGARTPIHDHTSWGIYVCVAGSLVEDRYVRQDDGLQPGRAHLRRDWRAIWRPGQQSHLLPYAGGIHRVANPNPGPAVSLHLYGPRQSAVDGRDYDPAQDIVCDRPIETPRRSPTRLAA